jgi:hypothetical protein
MKAILVSKIYCVMPFMEDGVDYSALVVEPPATLESGTTIEHTRLIHQ